MPSRIDLLISALIITFSLSARADNGVVTIFNYLDVALDSGGCLQAELDSAGVVGLLDCSGDSLDLNSNAAWRDGRLCLTAGIAGCDSVIVIMKSNRQLAHATFSLRPYLTTAQANEAGEPRPESPIQAAPPTSNLKIAGSKSFYADMSDRGRTNLAQGLTMTVTGDLGHDVSVRGSFSDRGLRDQRLVTRRFSELENIFLEVESPRLHSVFGNFQLQQQQFSLASFQRSVQGLELDYRRSHSQTGVAAAVPLGNYGEYEFRTQDGFYGPYRMVGRNGEQGVAVVENSDGVWLNGDKLARGRDQDYYFDYLRGELIFTGKRTIDADDRVRVEYEYQRLEYRKTLVTATNMVRSADSSRSVSLGYTGFLTARNDPLDFTLSESDIAALEQAGDDAGATIVSGARLVGAGQGSYLLESDSAGAQVYRFVGENLGDYAVSFSEFAGGDYSYLGNGRYQYVGNGRGRFLPLRQLPSPETVHLTAVAGQAMLGAAIQLKAESVLSSYDRNRFSSRDDGNNNSIAGNLGIRYRPTAGKLGLEANAEIIPDEFPQISRIDPIEDQYLWQKSDQTAVGRKRIQLGTIWTPASSLTQTANAGYSDEANGAIARRLNLNSEFNARNDSKGRLQINLASSAASTGSRSLMDIRPEVSTKVLPIELLVRGEYDERSFEADSVSTVDSKREIETVLSRSGITLGGKLRENRRRQSGDWSLLDRKRSAMLGISRAFAEANRIDANANANRFTQGSQTQNYQSGSVALTWPTLIPATELSANYRLNRRGFSQTNQTYLKVDPGEGDYLLIDSVYVAQPRGDYIRVIEQVGESTQNLEAEKRLQAELDLSKLLNSPISRGISIRYEVNYREIGEAANGFEAGWLLPPARYFAGASRLSQRTNDYRLRQYARSLRLRTEISYTLRRDENNLELTAPIRRNSDELRVSWNKSMGSRDNLIVALVNRERATREYGRLDLNLREKRMELSGSHFTGNWEFNLASMLSREHADSLDLLAYSLRIAPGLNYNLSAQGRIELSVFGLYVSEFADRELFVQMAEGFPRGTHCGGRLKIDFGLSDNFSFKVIAQAELREHDDNRYFLRSELISKFQ